MTSPYDPRVLGIPNEDLARVVGEDPITGETIALLRPRSRFVRPEPFRPWRPRWAEEILPQHRQMAARPVVVGRPPRGLYLTDFPVRVTATGGQELRLAVDVARYDQLDLELRVLSATGLVTVEITTGMQRASDDGWVSVGSFSAITGGNNATTAGCLSAPSRRSPAATMRSTRASPDSCGTALECNGALGWRHARGDLHDLRHRPRLGTGDTPVTGDVT